MAATFREVAVYSGVDESLPTGGQGILVPSGRSTLVILQDGKGLNVQSTVPSKVRVDEFTKGQEQTDAAKNASNPAEAKQRFGNGSWRIFRIKADAPVGLDKVKVEAKNAKGSAEATLKVLVVEKKPVKVHIRPVHVWNGKEFVRLGKAADPQKLLDEMNAIWIRQANVYFELGRTNPAKIEGLSPQTETIEMQKLPKGFLDEQDSDLLTFFLVPKVTNGKTHDKGATRSVVCSARRLFPDLRASAWGAEQILIHIAVMSPGVAGTTWQRQLASLSQRATLAAKSSSPAPCPRRLESAIRVGGGRSLLARERTASLVQRAKCLIGRDRGHQLVDVPRIFRFTRRLHLEQVHGMQLPAVLSNSPLAEKRVIGRHPLHGVHDRLAIIRAAHLIDRFQVVKDAGIHPGLHVIRHVAFRMTLLEAARPGARRVVHVPVERYDQQDSLRRREAQRPNVVLAHDQGQQLLALPQSKFARLLERIGRIAARVGKGDRLGARTLRAQQQRREIARSDRMARRAQHLAPLLCHFVGKLFLQIVPERVVGGDEEDGLDALAHDGARKTVTIGPRVVSPMDRVG